MNKKDIKLAIISRVKKKPLKRLKFFFVRNPRLKSWVVERIQSFTVSMVLINANNTRRRNLSVSFVKNFVTSVVKIYLIIFTFSFAQNPELQMAKANEFYQNEQISQAVEICQSLVDNGFESDALFYNLGNAYHRNGEFGKAIANFQRALRLNPKNDDAAFNLHHTRLKTRDFVEIPKPSVFIQIFESIRTKLSESYWLFFLQISILVGILLYFLRKLTFGKFRILRWIFQINLIFVLFFAGFWIANIVYFSTNKSGVITETAVEIFSEPSEFGTHIATVHDGLEIEFLKTQSGWQGIRLNDGTVGWVPKKSVLQFR